MTETSDSLRKQQSHQVKANASKHSTKAKQPRRPDALGSGDHRFVDENTGSDYIIFIGLITLTKSIKSIFVAVD